MQELTHRAPGKAKPNSNLSYKCATPLISNGLICNGLELLYLRAQFDPPFSQREVTAVPRIHLGGFQTLTITVGQTSLTINGSQSHFHHIQENPERAIT